MFAFLARYITRSRIEKQNLKRQKRFLNWDKIEKIALIVDNAQPINKSELDKFIEGTKKYMDVYFIELSAKQASFSDWICLTKKDKTFLNLPKAHVESTIKNRQYQLVINTTGKHTLFAANIVSLINPPYSCGNQNLYGETDLIVEKKSGVSLTAYLNDVIKYLVMIKTP